MTEQLNEIITDVKRSIAILRDLHDETLPLPSVALENHHTATEPPKRQNATEAKEDTMLAE